jgi:hypothetical protein
MLRGHHAFPWIKCGLLYALQKVNILPLWYLENAIRPGFRFNQIDVLGFCWSYRLKQPGTALGLLGGRDDLDVILNMLSAKTECSDRKDTIYGLLGLAKDVDELGIKADYSKEFSEILWDISIRMMSKGEMMRPLQYATEENIKDDLLLPSGHRLPSWVARWHSTHLLMTNDSHEASESWEGPVEFSKDNLILKICGVRVAQVTRVEPWISRSLTGNLALEHLNRLEFLINEAEKQMRNTADFRSVIALTFLDIEKWPGREGEDIGLALSLLQQLITLAKSRISDGETKTIDLSNLMYELEPSDLGKVEPFILDCHDKNGRALGFLSEERICILPTHAIEGDIIVIFRGGPQLYVLRPSGDTFFFVGHSSMIGAMHGQVLQEKGWKETVEEFSLI